MRFLTVGQMREADRAAVADGVPAMVLMNRAGAAVARAVETLAALRGGKRVLVVAGHGNNGGDACVAARCLFEDGFSVQVIMTCVPATLKGEAREAWDEMRTAGVPYVVLASPESWEEDIDVFSGLVLRQGVVVDGVLGTGCSGAPSGAAEKAIRWINGMRPHALVVSADLPSGMNGDTGEAEGAVVRADVTVTFARPKRCFLNEAQAELVGHLTVADIGIADAICDVGTDGEQAQMIALPELARWFPRRAWGAHKGALGHVCVVGGSACFRHAPVLAALGAVRGGAGLVTVAGPQASVAALAAQVPEAMARVLDAPQGVVSAEALAACGPLEGFDALVVGPGLSVCAETVAAVRQVLSSYRGRLVLDADGLNALAALYAEGWRPADGPELLLTPHPGEAARLLGVTAAEVQADRQGTARRLAERYRAAVALKGAGTLVCGVDGVVWLNRTGNPGMASGGTGDVLAGLAGALWAQGMAAWQAAAAAVWAHGEAGDLAAFAEGQTALSATRLAGYLGRVLQVVERQA